MRAFYLCMRSGAFREYLQRLASLSVTRGSGSAPLNTFPCVCDRNPTKAVEYHGPVRRNRAPARPEWSVEIRPPPTRSARPAVVVSVRLFPVLTALERRRFRPRTRPARPLFSSSVRARARACARPERRNSPRPSA